MEDLSKMIYDYRVKNDLSQRAMAERCKVSLQTLNSIENKLQEPSKFTRDKILLVLNEEV